MDRFRRFPWTKAFWFNIQSEGKGSPKQGIPYRQYPSSEQKQWKAKVKVKGTDPTWSQILFFPETPTLPRNTMMFQHRIFLERTTLENFCFGGQVLWGKEGNLSWWDSVHLPPECWLVSWNFTPSQLSAVSIRKTSENILWWDLIWSKGQNPSTEPSKHGTGSAVFYKQTHKCPSPSKGSCCESDRLSDSLLSHLGCQFSSFKKGKLHKRLHFHLPCGGVWNTWWVGSHEQNKFIKIPSKAALLMKLARCNMAKMPALCGWM